MRSGVKQEFLGAFSKLGVRFLGSQIIRIRLSWGLYSGLLILGSIGFGDLKHLTEIGYRGRYRGGNVFVKLLLRVEGLLLRMGGCAQPVEAWALCGSFPK